MALNDDDLLFGRLALHYQVLTTEQLKQVSAEPGEPGSLGSRLLERGLLTTTRHQQLVAAQHEYQAKGGVGDRNTPQAIPTVTTAPPRPEAGTSPALLKDQLPPPAPRPFAVTAATALDTLLTHAVAQGASDIHLHAGSPVKLRLFGKLVDIEGGSLSPQISTPWIRAILNSNQQAELDTKGQVDFAHAVPGVARFRGNAYRQQWKLDAVFRAIPPRPPTLAELGLPDSLRKLCHYHQGLVLLTGPAGCGKSATLAALGHLINQERHDHIITVEDPIEVLHPSLGCVVNQRQVGPHTSSFARALRAALREDPDVIAIGELRDLETISLALTAAETGHLVLATLHTSSAIRTINRLLGVFPPDQQEQIRTMVSESLRAIVSQRLLTRVDGSGRVPAVEILLGNKAVGNLIRENKTFQLHSVLQTGSSHGMCLLDAALGDLLRQGVITREEALLHAEEPQRLPARP